jgi:adenosine/AMP kinase
VAPRSTSNEAELWNKLVETANKLSDGHLTVIKLKTNWRVGFFTPNKREDIDLMAAGKTFADAARMALEISVEEFWPGSRPRVPK